MDDLEIGKRMQVISTKYGWEDDNECSGDEVRARLKIIRAEDSQLWEQMMSNVQSHSEDLAE